MPKSFPRPSVLPRESEKVTLGAAGWLQAMVLVVQTQAGPISICLERSIPVLFGWQLKLKCGENFGRMRPYSSNVRSQREENV